MALIWETSTKHTSRLWIILSIFGSSNEVTNLKIATLSAEVDGLKTECVGSAKIRQSNS